MRVKGHTSLTLYLKTKRQFRRLGLNWEYANACQRAAFKIQAAPLL